jgi:hypothetical protein
MLANASLEHVLDDWWEREVKPRMKGRCCLIRLADDCVIGCEREDAARRILGGLPQRFARFQRTIHPQKTRLVRFQPSHQEDTGERGDGTFDVLGLTHDWAQARRGVPGHHAPHGQDAATAGDAGGVAWVPRASARPDSGPIPGALPEAPQALPVLRELWERPQAGSALSGCGARVAVWVASAWGAANAPVGDVRQPPGGAGAAPAVSRASQLSCPAGPHMFCSSVVPTR